MLKKLTAFLAGAMLMMGGNALAFVYSPSLSELANFTVQESLNLSSAANTGINGLGGESYSAIFNPGTHSAVVLFGETFSATDFSDYVYNIRIDNTDETTWTYALTYQYNNTWYYLPSVTITSGSFAILSGDFDSISEDAITGVGVAVVDNVPHLRSNGSLDRTAEFDVTPVPEPGTMVLLGAGMLGLAIFGKRRMNRE